MPIFDTPITTDDRNISKIISQPLPIIIILHRNDVDKPLDDAIVKEAKRGAGTILVTRVNADENPDTYGKYGKPVTPAVITLQNGKVKAKGEQIRPGDFRAYLAHLLNDTPLPTKAPASATGNPAQPQVVTDSNFREAVLKSKKPVLVDFWAEWCGPCHSIAPHVNDLAKQYGDKVKVMKMDVDANRVIPSRYQITSIPSLILFQDGQVAERVTGANPTALRKMVEKYAK